MCSARSSRTTDVASGEIRRRIISTNQCKSFLRQCEVFFTHQPDAYQRDATCFCANLALLPGELWIGIHQVWDSKEQVRTSYSHFSKFVCKVFEYPAVGRDNSLLSMLLDSEPAAGGGWNRVGFKVVFQEELNSFKRNSHAGIRRCLSCNISHWPSAWTTYEDKPLNYCDV